MSEVRHGLQAPVAGLLVCIVLGGFVLLRLRFETPASASISIAGGFVGALALLCGLRFSKSTSHRAAVIAAVGGILIASTFWPAVDGVGMALTLLAVTVPWGLVSTADSRSGGDA